MRRPWLAIGAILGALLGGPSIAAAEPPRAFIELFTSQGCSSCPPADRILGELARDRSLIAMSLPIDYWDYLGWKDSLAQPRHTARQRGYATMRGDREVYTPQIVINGLVHVVGSDRNAIENAIARTKGRDGSLSIPVSLAMGDEAIIVNIVPVREAEAVAEVWLVAVAAAIPVDIKRGENRGRSVTYHNIARRWIKVGTWTGGRQSWNVPKSELKAEGLDTLSVVVQAGSNDKPGALLGADSISLK